MRMLLTSAGIKNASIQEAMINLLGRPIADCDALCIPTATYPLGGPGSAYRFISGTATTPMCELGWRTLGVLELTALPSLQPEHWVPDLKQADVLLVNGGDAPYLADWLRRSGLAEMLPSLDTVWVGLSGGSMVMAPRVGEEFVSWSAATGDDRGLGLVDFAMFPHLDHPDLPENTLATAKLWAAKLPGPGYAIDDQTAIQVVDDAIEIVSEGNWTYFDS